MTFEPCVDCLRYGWEMDWEKEETLKCEDGEYRCVLHAPTEYKCNFSLMDEVFSESKFSSLVESKIRNELLSDSSDCFLQGIICPTRVSINIGEQDVRCDFLRMEKSQWGGDFSIVLNNESYIKSCALDSVCCNGDFTLSMGRSENVLVDGGRFKKVNLLYKKVGLIRLFSVKCIKSVLVTAECADELICYNIKVRDEFRIATDLICVINFKFVTVPRLIFSLAEIIKKAEFMRLESAGIIDLQGVIAPDKSISFVGCLAETLSNLCFSSSELSCFNLKRCSYPDCFRWENDKYFSDIQKIDNYRALKALAISEQNQPLVSRWHRKEWEMRLNGIREKRPRIFWASPEWLYSFVSGFGEDACRAGLVLLGIAGVLLLFSGVLAFWDNPTRGLQTTGEYFLQCLPLFSVATPVGTEYTAKGQAYFWFAKLLLSLQTGMLAFALRNKFRRQ